MSSSYISKVKPIQTRLLRHIEMVAQEYRDAHAARIRAAAAELGINPDTLVPDAYRGAGQSPSRTEPRSSSASEVAELLRSLRVDERRAL